MEKIDKIEISPEIEKELCKLTEKWAHKIDNEYGILYHKFRSWYKKYGVFPTIGSIKRIINNIRVDLFRTETKTRVKSDGTVVGKGSGIFLHSLDKSISDDSESNGDFLSLISDPNEVLPNEIERFDFENLLKEHGPTTLRDKEILKDCVEGNRLASIAKKFNITESRVCQLRKKIFSNLRGGYNELLSPVLDPTPEKPKRIRLNGYADHLIEKKERVSKYRSKLIRKSRRIRRKSVKIKEQYNSSQPANTKNALKIIEEFKRSRLSLEEVCKKYKVNFDSFRQKTHKLGISIRILNEEKFEKENEILCAEWDRVKGTMSLPEFCRRRNIRHFNFRNWLKKRESAKSKWYCIRTKTKREHIVAISLTRYLNLQTFAPRITINKSTVRGRRKFKESMFPSYIFVNFDLGNFQRVAYFPGIGKIVRANKRIPSIPNSVIDKMRKGLKDIEENKEYFEEGDLVEILEGSFEGYCAKVYKPKMSGNRVALLIQSLENMTKIKVKNCQITKVKNNLIPVTKKVTLEMFERLTKEKISSPALCHEYGVTRSSFNRMCIKLKISIAKVRKRERERTFKSAYIEWEKIKEANPHLNKGKGILNLKKFCDDNQINYFNFKNWINKKICKKH